MDRSFLSLSRRLRAAAFTSFLASAAVPSLVQAKGHPWRGSWLVARASADVVQNTTGNAYALQVGIAPRLRIDRVPVGLKLVLAYGALRDTQHHVFSVPSAQALLDWSIAPRLDIALGAGAQFWFAPSGPVTRPVVTVEAHYVPPHKLLRFARSAFVASSIGASSGAGLQVRAGLEFDFARGPATLASPIDTDAISDVPPAASTKAPMVCPPVPVCPPCPVATPQAPSAPAQAPLVDRFLGEGMTFAFNITTLDVHARAYVARLAAALTAPGVQFRTLSITGHASARGTEAQNLTVSLHRAQNVAHALKAHGVPEHKLTIHAVGESEPLPGLSPNDAAQQCVVLQLLGADPHVPLETTISLPQHSTEQQL